MNQEFKKITAENVSLKQGEFRNDSSMTRKLPDDIKSRILTYLKEQPAEIIGDVVLIDPVTGKRYNHTSIVRNKDGFQWSTATIYMLEHYDIRLSDDFLKLF